MNRNPKIRYEASKATISGHQIVKTARSHEAMFRWLATESARRLGKLDVIEIDDRTFPPKITRFDNPFT